MFPVPVEALDRQRILFIGVSSADTRNASFVAGIAAWNGTQLTVQYDARLPSVMPRGTPVAWAGFDPAVLPRILSPKAWRRVQELTVGVTACVAAWVPDTLPSAVVITDAFFGLAANEQTGEVFLMQADPAGDRLPYAGESCRPGHVANAEADGDQVLMNSETLHECLRRLIPHVDTARIALTGGVAISVHVGAVHGDRTAGVPAEDIDFVADDVAAVRQTVTNDFLVSHFHLPQPGYAKFLVQLVDPVARVRLDFFPDSLRALGRASVVVVAGVPLRVLEAHDILDHKIALLSKASADSPVEEKHYADGQRLGMICGRDVPPVTASQLASTVYSQDVDAICARCHVRRHDGFPLAPKREIFDVLGYV